MVLEDLFKNHSFEELEAIFISLNIKVVYVLKPVSKKEDFSKDFISFPSSKISFKNGFLLKDVSLFHFYRGNLFVFCEAGSLKNNFLISNHKHMKFLKDPLSSKLSFDAQNASLCSRNKVKVVFDVNKFRDKHKISNLKQASFIISVLKKNYVDMIFASFACNTEDLVSPGLVLFNFLKTFSLEDSIVQRFLDEKIFF